MGGRFLWSFARGGKNKFNAPRLQILSMRFVCLTDSVPVNFDDQIDQKVSISTRCCVTVADFIFLVVSVVNFRAITMIRRSVFRIIMRFLWFRLALTIFTFKFAVSVRRPVSLWSQKVDFVLCRTVD